MSSSKCHLHKTCQQLYDLVRTLGATPRLLPGCQQDGVCQAAVENAELLSQQLSPDNATQVTVFLRDVFHGDLPIDQSAVALKQTLEQEPFYCGEIDVEIRQPCGVTSCTYWSDTPWTRNCILFYLLDHHRAVLDIKELAFLLGRQIGELRRHTNNITAELRHWALKRKTAQQDDQLPVRIVESASCAVCGAELDETPIYRHGFCYCSEECIDKKPPLDLRIEQDFRLPIERVLQICVDSFAALRPICHALSVKTRELDDLCLRYDISTAHLS